MSLSLSRISKPLLASLFLAASACGGGGDPAPSPAPAPAPPAAVDATLLQGRWATPASAVPAYSALVLAAPANSAQAWMLAEDASVLLKLTLTGGAALGFSGRSYGFVNGVQAGRQVSGSASATLATTPRTLTLPGTADAMVVLSQATTPSALPAQADITGGWRATSGQGAVVTVWNVDAGGKVTGSSSTGCTWSGTLSAPAAGPVFAAALAENCAGNASQFAGVASLNATKSQLVVLATTTDESKAAVLAFGRP